MNAKIGEISIYNSKRKEDGCQEYYILIFQRAIYASRMILKTGWIEILYMKNVHRKCFMWNYIWTQMENWMDIFHANEFSLPRFIFSFLFDLERVIIKYKKKKNDEECAETYEEFLILLFCLKINLSTVFFCSHNLMRNWMNAFKYWQKITL